jgi:hypothetical protein
VSGFIKRLVLTVVAAKLQRRAYRRGHHPAVRGLLRELDHQLHGRRYGHHGHYGYHGHYRRRRW